MARPTLVYVAFCIPNNKLYFGITSGSLHERIRKHVWAAGRGSQFRFHLALRKHGAANFAWYEIGRGTWVDACDIERALIQYFNTRDVDLGYNDTDGGEGRYGKPASAVTRQKIGDAQKGRVFSDEHRARLREARAKRSPVTEDTRLKQRAYMLGRKMNLSQDARARISAANKGKPRSEEARAKMRAGHARRSAPPPHEDERG